MLSRWQAPGRHLASRARKTHPIADGPWQVLWPWQTPQDHPGLCGSGTPCWRGGRYYRTLWPRKINPSAHYCGARADKLRHSCRHRWQQLGRRDHAGVSVSCCEPRPALAHLAQPGQPLTAPRRPKLAQAEHLKPARQALAQLGLADVDPCSLPADLSSGQCQRVSVGRALIASPRLLLADEPTSALDTLAKRRVLDMLVEAAAAGTAILLISHDRKMLGTLCDRVLELQQGQLRAVLSS